MTLGGTTGLLLKKKQIPENYNMDTQNDGLETGDSFEKYGHFLVSMLNFWGVHP